MNHPMRSARVPARAAAGRLSAYAAFGASFAVAAAFVLGLVG